MFKNIDEFKKLNSRLVLKCIFIIYTVLTIAYIIEFVKGNRDISYVLFFCILLWGFYFIEYISLKIESFQKYTPFLITLGYTVFYVFCMRTTIVGMTWIYAFPFSCVLPFFFDKLYWIIITYFSFLGINVLEVLSNKTYYFSSAKTITELEQRFACLILVFSFLAVLAYLLSRYNNVVKNIYKEAAIDSITGLHTEDYVDEKIKPMILRNKNLSYTLVMINIDKFHRFNESYGHAFGDSVLEIVSNIIIEEFRDVRANASLCRLYGDKFIIVIANRVYDEIKPNYTSVKKHMNNIVLKKGNSEIFINATISVTDTRFCEHTYDGLFKRVRFLQDIARQKGMNNILEDSIDF